MVDVKNVLRCLGHRVACRVACCGNCGGRLSPADNMLSDHAHASLGNEADEVQHIITQNLVLQQHTLLELQLVGVLAVCQTEGGL